MYVAVGVLLGEWGQRSAHTFGVCDRSWRVQHEGWVVKTLVSERSPTIRTGLCNNAVGVRSVEGSSVDTSLVCKGAEAMWICMMRSVYLGGHTYANASECCRAEVCVGVAPTRDGCIV